MAIGKRKTIAIGELMPVTHTNTSTSARDGYFSQQLPVFEVIFTTWGWSSTQIPVMSFCLMLVVISSLGPKLLSMWARRPWK